jgi:hypothetical protein
MDRVLKFSGAVLWSMVFMTTAFSYSSINYSNDVKLEDLCNEDNYSPQYTQKHQSCEIHLDDLPLLF